MYFVFDAYNFIVHRRYACVANRRGRNIRNNPFIPAPNRITTLYYYYSTKVVFILSTTIYNFSKRFVDPINLPRDQYFIYYILLIGRFFSDLFARSLYCLNALAENTVCHVRVGNNNKNNNIRSSVI